MYTTNDSITERELIGFCFQQDSKTVFSGDQFALESVVLKR